MKKNEAPVTSKSNQVLPTTEKNVKTTKSQATETVKVSANNNQKADTTQNPVQKTENKSECPL
jgi:hypothetical protein